nr:hypothetical protein [Gemmatimonadaceae bacterium]
MTSDPPHAARTPPDAVPTDGYVLRLRVLGPAALVAVAPDGGTVERLGPGKPLALLVRVAMAGDRGVAREALGALLWSAAEPERQRQSVRQAMLQLRRAAGRDLFATTASGALVLAQPLPSDLDALLARLTAGDRAGALALVGGVFLADLQPAGAPGFERWADFERVRIGALVAGAREAAAREALEGGRCREARRLATLARQEAPDPEAAWGLEIEAALADGDPTAAGMSAEALAAWLRD